MLLNDADNDRSHRINLISELYRCRCFRWDWATSNDKLLSQKKL